MLIALGSTPVVSFFLIDANDNPVISQAPTIKVLKPGATAYATITPTVTEDSTDLGTYWFTLTDTYTADEGFLSLVITGGGATWRDRLQVIGEGFLPAVTLNQIADHVLRRYTGNARTSLDGDDNSGDPYFKSLLGAIATQCNTNTMSGADRQIYEEDGTTIFSTMTGTTTSSAVDNIVGMTPSVE